MNLRRFSGSFADKSFEVAANFREAGPDLLLFLHGLGCSKDSFHHIWKRIDLADFSVLAVDLIGFGDSAESSNFSYTMEAQAQVCADVLDKFFDDRKLHIVGHSMGGAVALLLPDKILNSTQTFTNVEGNLIGADCAVASRKIIGVPRKVFEAELLPELQKKFAILGENYTAFESTTADALYRSAESLVSWSDSNKLLEAFLALSCQKAYFYGEDNAAHPTIKRIGYIPTVEIKRSGHFPMNDNPIDFYNELHKFVTTGRKT